MREINLKNIKKIHFVGIGGISMLGLTYFMLSNGKIVTGSDFQKSSEIEALKDKGVNVFLGHKKKNIDKDIDLVVFTGAIKEDNIELVTAKKYGIEIVERSEFLGLISREFKNVIAISGTHGKTTTTAMIGKIFEVAKLKPTIHIGGEVLDFDSNFVIGKNDYFITEACEYRESFKYLKPNTSVITNIEADHLDYYKTFDNLKIAFNNFANNTTDNLILCSNRYIKTNSMGAKITNTGIDCLSQFMAYNILQTKNGYTFEVYEYDKCIGEFEINLLGYHNVLNSLCAITVALKYGIDVEIIKKALKSFKGVKRRYEQVGNIEGIPIICDYAHHPTEIKNSINGICEHYKNILCVFQPHTYTRTLNLMKEFKDCFFGVKSLAIFKTYSAREKYIKGGSAKSLFKNIESVDKIYIKNIKQLESFLNEKIKGTSRNYDVILVLGAGDIYSIVKKVIFSKKIC